MCVRLGVRKYWTTTLDAALSSIDTVIHLATAVFVSRHHSDQMTEGFQTSKVPLSVQNPKMAENQDEKVKSYLTRTAGAADTALDLDVDAPPRFPLPSLFISLADSFWEKSKEISNYFVSLIVMSHRSYQFIVWHLCLWDNIRSSWI